MWRLEIGLTMFWFIPLFLGFVVAFIFMRFSYRQMQSEGEEAEEETPPSAPSVEDRVRAP